MEIDDLNRLYQNWEKTREKTCREILKLADELDKLKKDVAIVKVTFSSVSVLSSLCLIGGMIAAIPTGGASVALGLSLAGVISGVTSGVAAATNSICDHVLTEKKVKQAKILIEKDIKASENITKKIEYMNSRLILGDISKSLKEGAGLANKTLSCVKLITKYKELAKAGELAAKGYKLLAPTSKFLKISGGIAVLFLVKDVIDLAINVKDLRERSTHACKLRECVEKLKNLD